MVIICKFDREVVQYKNNFYVMKNIRRPDK